MRKILPTNICPISRLTQVSDQWHPQRPTVQTIGAKRFLKGSLRGIEDEMLGYIVLAYARKKKKTINFSRMIVQMTLLPDFNC